MAEWSKVLVPKTNVRGFEPHYAHTMVSLNKKKKAKNSYMANANKTTDKLKRINFYNKINRKKDGELSFLQD